MGWQSEKFYPGGKIAYIPLPDCDKFMVIYRTNHGDFCRGFKTMFELMAEGVEPVKEGEPK